MIDTTANSSAATAAAAASTHTDTAEVEERRRRREALMKMAMSGEGELTSFGGGPPEDYIPGLAAKRQAEKQDKQLDSNKDEE